jgi:dihydrodipicolinate synthase/N-acetylneuraminate lyase
MTLHGTIVPLVTPFRADESVVEHLREIDRLERRTALALAG